MTIDVESAVIAAEQERRAAMVAGDVDALDTILGEYFTYAHINGLVEERQAYLDRLRAGAVSTPESSATNLRCAVRPGYVLLSGRSRIGFAWADGSSSGVIETWFLSVWEQDGGRWRITAYASTPLPAS